MLMSPDYFSIAVNEVRNVRTRLRMAKAAVIKPTHWSYYDAPQWALCGQRIEPEQFAKEPTCESCRQALAQMQMEDVR